MYACAYAYACVCVSGRKNGGSKRGTRKGTIERERMSAKMGAKEGEKGRKERKRDRTSESLDERERERERGEKVPNTRKTRAPYFCKSGFIRKARVVRRDVELPELPILYKKTFTAREEMRSTPRYRFTRIYIYTYIHI